MPTSCVAPHKCGTHATGWLNGAHPSVEEGKVTKKVCFSWRRNCCQWSINIEVLNCGGFFLYHFKGTPRDIHVIFVIVVLTEGIKVFLFPLILRHKKMCSDANLKFRIDNQVAFHTRGNYLLYNLVNLRSKTVLPKVLLTVFINNYSSSPTGL